MNMKFFNLKNFHEVLDYCMAKNVELVAVSKNRPNDQVMRLYDAGQRVFGENRPQELVKKYHALPKDIHWHMIGHLQTNKVKYIMDMVDMIHSGDRVSILKEIQKQASKADKVIDVLLQIKIALEDSKWGWDKDELVSYLEGGGAAVFPNIRFRGVMGMATFTDDEREVTREFAGLKSFYDKLKTNFFSADDFFDTISMGMSGDYKIAIAQGSTMVRIGTLLFSD